MNQALLDTSGLFFLGFYLIALIGLGIVGRIAQKSASLKEFYLGGGGFGVAVLFLTMYATQYSGNSLIGFAGNAYRNGWFFLVSVTFMIVIVAGYLLYAPKLYPLARKHGFITVGDFIDYRYSHTLLTMLIVAIGIMALSNYMLTNLKAIGYIVEMATGGMIGFAEGIILMSIVMVIYETLGGMRSVAWSDAIQGILLFLGVLIIFITVLTHYGTPFETSMLLLEHRSELFREPLLEDILKWGSTLILILFGISVYPQAIQRIYAAKDTPTLRRSLQLMVVMPLLTTLPLIIIALVGAATIPELDRQGSEQIILEMLSRLNTLPYMNWVITIFITAAIAAIMSTVDSAMLAIASLFTQDIYKRIRPEASQKKLTFVGKVFSWIMMVGMVTLAIELPATLWHLIRIKLEILCQIAPAIMLGVWFHHIKANSILYGLLVGTSFTLISLLTTLPDKPFGLHAGVVGLILNVLVVLVSEKWHKKKKSH